MSNIDYVFVTARNKEYGWKLKINTCVSGIRENREYTILKRISLCEIVSKVRQCISDVFVFYNLDTTQYPDQIFIGCVNVSFFFRKVDGTSTKFYDLLDISLKDFSRYHVKI